jgi:L-ascorbate metabolism protein UlaG (beta-lactamase superfamily)
VPVQHWSMRTGLDKFKELWCGFVMDVATGSDSYHRSEWTEHDDCRKEGQPEKLMREETTAALSDERHPNSSSDRLLFKRVLHAGDTGMCSVFKEIGQALGPMDVALIPIGAYSPRSFMAPQHIDPAEAVQVHLDVRSRNSFGMHWGTFILTDEPIDEPPRLLREALVKRGLAEGEFRTLKHGETARI